MEWGKKKPEVCFQKAKINFINNQAQVGDFDYRHCVAQNLNKWNLSKDWKFWLKYIFFILFIYYDLIRVISFSLPEFAFLLEIPSNETNRNLGDFRSNEMFKIILWPDP